MGSRGAQTIANDLLALGYIKSLARPGEWVAFWRRRQ
jgi:hypothetical protein